MKYYILNLLMFHLRYILHEIEVPNQSYIYVRALLYEHLAYKYQLYILCDNYARTSRFYLSTMRQQYLLLTVGHEHCIKVLLIVSMEYENMYLY